MSILQGIRRLIDPQELGRPYWNYGVLAVSATLGASSFSLAYRQIRANAPNESLWMAIRTSKDPRNLSVLLIDTADLIGVGLAFLGVLLGQVLHSAYPDAVAALLIGLVLAGIAVVLANESRHLLIGESTDEETVRDIRDIVERDSAVEHAPRPATMHLGPDQVLLALDVCFGGDLSVARVREAVERLERAIQEKHPETTRILLEVGSLDGRHDSRQPGGPVEADEQVVGGSTGG
jgi:divalent metal cation (Fe/Co/Zn/Cd) transporter